MYDHTKEERAELFLRRVHQAVGSLAARFGSPAGVRAVIKEMDYCNVDPDDVQRALEDLVKAGKLSVDSTNLYSPKGSKLRKSKRISKHAVPHSTVARWLTALEDAADNPEELRTLISLYRSRLG